MSSCSGILDSGKVVAHRHNSQYSGYRIAVFLWTRKAVHFRRQRPDAVVVEVPRGRQDFSSSGEPQVLGIQRYRET
jgi:hypothetical protein